jgi:hypothetical protein
MTTSAGRRTTRALTPSTARILLPVSLSPTFRDDDMTAVKFSPSRRARKAQREFGHDPAAMMR